jgi:hypothetical protein
LKKPPLMRPLSPGGFSANQPPDAHQPNGPEPAGRAAGRRWPISVRLVAAIEALISTSLTLSPYVIERIDLLT